MSQPDFSIVIPTFNRSNFLRLAITSVLRQTGVSFEIIVSDDCSTDDTREIVKGFGDRRIKYIKNKIRLGYALNVQKCFRHSFGNYIFTLGDDDFILEEKTLLEILKVMKIYKVGVGKIGSIAYDTSPKSPYRPSIMSDKLIILKPKRDKRIILRTLDFGLGFYSGLIFNNSLINKRRMINHMGYVYFPLAFDVIQKYGIAYIPNHIIVSHLSLQMMPIYFNIEKYGSFFMKDLFKIIKEFVSNRDYEIYKKEFIRREMILLPNMKYFTNNGNYFQILKKIVEMDKSILVNPEFIIFALSGFIPNFMIKALRDFIVWKSQKETRDFLKKYNYFQKLEKIGIN